MKKIDCSFIYKEEIDKNINMLKHFIEAWVKSQNIRNEELFQLADDDFYFYRFAVERQEKAAKILLTNILWRVLKEYNIPVEYSHDAPFIFIIKENHERIGYRLADFLEDEDINSILKSNHVDKAIILRTSKGKQTNKLIEQENQQYKDANVNIRALTIHDFYLKQFGEEEYKTFIDSIDNYLNVTKEITGYKSVKFLSKMNLASIKIFEQKNLKDWDYLDYRYQIINVNDKKVQNYLYIAQKEIIFENLDDMHKSYIFDKLYETMVNSNEYAASFITSEWLYYSFEGKKNFDYTSVVSGYLKSIEQLLYKIVMLNIDNDCKIAMKRDMLKKAFRQNIPVFELIDNKFNKIPENKQGNNYRFTNYPYIEFTEHHKEFMDSSIGTFEYFLRCNKHIFSNPDNAKIVTDMNMFYYHETSSKKLPPIKDESYQRYCSEMLECHIKALLKAGKNIKFVYINNSQVSQWLCDSDINTNTVFGDRKIPVFFGRMLSGGIDSFSRLRLVNEIKDYLNKLESKIEK